MKKIINEPSEIQSELIQVKVKPSVKKKLLEMAGKDSRKLADWIRVQLEKLIK